MNDSILASRGQKYVKSAILTAFIVETLSATAGLLIPHGGPICSLLYFLSGLYFSLKLLYASELTFKPVLPALRKGRAAMAIRATPGIGSWPKPDTDPRRLTHYRMILTALVGLVIFDICRLWFDEIPLDVNYADMLPIIKVMGQRFASGHGRQVYDVIPWIWHGVQPIYLPAMWLPFVPAVWLDVDLRWITATGLFAVFAVFLWIYRPLARSYWSFLTGIMAFLLFWWIFINNSPGIITASEEGVVIAYYSFLVLALLSGNIWLIAICASFCMLSRYALAGWIPAYFLYLLLTKRFRKALIFSLTGISCFVLLFLLPVGLPTFLRLLKLPGDYIQFAGRVWHDSPSVFYSGLGLAWLFGPHGIPILHMLLITLSFLVPLTTTLVCCLGRKRKQLANIPVATLKLTLVIFYSFIDVPYSYLFYTSSLVSLLIVAIMIHPSQEEQRTMEMPSGA